MKTFELVVENGGHHNHQMICKTVRVIYHTTVSNSNVYVIETEDDSQIEDLQSRLAFLSFRLSPFE